MKRLWEVELIQIMLFFDSQVRGTSITVGIISFSIVGGLDFGRSLVHRCLRLLLEELGLMRPHKPRTP